MKVFIDGAAGTTGLRIRERLEGRSDMSLMELSDELRKDASARRDALNSCDVAILCLPDDAAREAVALIENTSVRVIDASTAHRTNPDWVYGLPEIRGQREKIAVSKRVANPGCYATGFITLIRPLVEEGYLPKDAVIPCHALSGYTGGGKKAIAQYEAAERERELDSPRHYALSLSHKHLPEMRSVCGLSKAPLFAPMICDFPCGMAVSVLLDMGQLIKGGSVSEIRKLYSDYYAGSPVVKLSAEGEPASGYLAANDIAGRDGLVIYVSGNDERLLLTSKLDNLGKGASGAAVQNLNIMLGVAETTGLSLE